MVAVGCSPLLLSLLLLLPFFFFAFTAGSNLSQFSEQQVWGFIRQVPRQSVNPECGRALDKVERYLTDKRTLEEQRHFFSEAFSAGQASQFISRDQDRWLFNAFKCIKAAGETSYSASEYPMHYCYGQGTTSGQHGGDTAYGMCIPSPCSEDQDRTELLREWRKVAENGTDSGALEFGDCTKSRHSRQWWQQPVPLVHFSSDLVLVALVGLATALHWRRGLDPGQASASARPLALQLLLAFSAKENVRKLVQMPKDARATIQCFFGLRFGAMVWTLVGHSFIFVQAFLANVDQLKDNLVDNFWTQWITNFTLSVDVFLVLSGTLTAYSWFRRWQHKGVSGTAEPEPGWTSWAYWLRFYRHRVVRLWPAYIYTLVAVTTRVSITHYHPMWPPTDPAVQCPKHWLENVLFINSLTDNRCMPWTWYIGTEFLFYLLSPIFLLSLRQSASAGLWLCASVSLLSALFNAVTMLRYNFPPTQMLWRQPAIFNDDFILHHLVIYIKPWFRIGPYLIGILLGYVLALHSVSPQVKRTAGSADHRFVGLGWALATVAGFWSVYGLYPALQGWNWPIYHLLYGSTFRLVFSAALGWLIYACHTGIGGPLNWLLSLSPLVPLSNLCYTAYLFHMIPVVFTYMVSPFPLQFSSNWQILRHCLIQLAISYCYAIMCTLLAELPALNIERILLGRGGRSASRPMTSATAAANGCSLASSAASGRLCAAEEQLRTGAGEESRERADA